MQVAPTVKSSAAAKGAMSTPPDQVPAGVIAPIFILTVSLGFAAADTAIPTERIASLGRVRVGPTIT